MFDRDKVKIKNCVFSFFVLNLYEVKDGFLKREKWLNFVDVRVELMWLYL